MAGRLRGLLDAGGVSIQPWARDCVGVPNAIIRSALFAAIPDLSEERDRYFYCDREVRGLKGVRVLHTGPQLCQADLELWMALLALLHQAPFGQTVRCRLSEVLRAQGLTDSGKNRDKTWARLMRLSKTNLTIEGTGFRYVGNLVYSAELNDFGVLEVRLSERMAAIFSVGRYTLLDLRIRLALRGQPLAGWLYGFYVSHRDPYTLKVDTLRELSGSTVASRDKFCQQLRVALARVQSAAEKHAKYCQFEVEGGAQGRVSFFWLKRPF